jgi:hypothetical protein
MKSSCNQRCLDLLCETNCRLYFEAWRLNGDATLKNQAPKSKPPCKDRVPPPNLSPATRHTDSVG